MPKSAFNNINKLSINIFTSLGRISNDESSFAWGPEDVQVEATPGNDGNLYNTVFGAGGDALLNATPLINNWIVVIHLLHKSETYARLSYLMQQELEATKTGTNLGWYNFEMKDTNDPTVDGEHYYETLKSSQAKMITIPGRQWGFNIGGDMAFAFLLANADYMAPGYVENEIATSQDPFPLRNEA